MTVVEHMMEHLQSVDIHGNLCDETTWAVTYVPGIEKWICGCIVDDNAHVSEVGIGPTTESAIRDAYLEVFYEGAIS